MLATRTLTVLIALALTLAAGPAAAQLSGQTVVIAVAGPLSGGASALGIEQKQGVQVAVDERNAAGGILGASVVLADVSAGACEAERLGALHGAATPWPTLHPRPSRALPRAGRRRFSGCSGDRR